MGRGEATAGLDRPSRRDRPGAWMSAALPRVTCDARSSPPAIRLPGSIGAALITPFARRWAGVSMKFFVPSRPGMARAPWGQETSVQNEGLPARRLAILACGRIMVSAGSGAALMDGEKAFAWAGD